MRYQRRAILPLQSPRHARRAIRRNHSEKPYAALLPREILIFWLAQSFAICGQDAYKNPLEEQLPESNAENSLNALAGVSLSILGSAKKITQFRRGDFPRYVLHLELPDQVAGRFVPNSQAKCPANVPLVGFFDCERLRVDD